MTKRAFKIVFSVFLTLGLIQSSAVFAVSYDQLISNTSKTGNGGAYGGSGAWYPDFIYDFPTEVNISSFSLAYNTSNVSCPTDFTDQLSLTIYDGLSTAIGYSTALAQSNGGYITFTFSEPVPVTYGRINLGRPHSTCNDSNYFDFEFTAPYQDSSIGFYDIYDTIGVPKFYINSNSPEERSNIWQASTATPIVWASPPYNNGMNTPDFKNWQTCVFIDTGGSGNTNSYFVSVAYGTSTLSSFLDLSYDDNNTTTADTYFPIYSLPIIECPIQTKNATLTPDTYMAQAGLYRHSVFGGNEFIASSSILSFSVATGTPVDFPNQFAGLTDTGIICDFSVSNTGVSAVDDVVNGVVNGGCGVLTWLFVPKAKDIPNWGELWGEVKNKPPLGYFTANIEAVDMSGGEADLVFPDMSAFEVMLQPLRIGLAVIIWVLAGIWIFKRFSKWNFHH